MRVKELRKAANLSQSQLAAYSGVGRSYITRLENGEFMEPSYEKLRRIARVLHLSVDQVAGYEAVDTSAVEARLRSFRRFPMAILDQLDEVGKILFVERVPRDDIAGDNTQTECGGDDEPDDAEPQAK